MRTATIRRHVLHDNLSSILLELELYLCCGRTAGACPVGAWSAVLQPGKVFRRRSLTKMKADAETLSAKCYGLGLQNSMYDGNQISELFSERDLMRKMKTSKRTHTKQCGPHNTSGSSPIPTNTATAKQSLWYFLPNTRYCSLVL